MSNLQDPQDAKADQTTQDHTTTQHSLEDAGNGLVENILLAEFDIDQGSTVRYQYPKPMDMKEEFISEYMLPEGAHLRETDWTIFFLRDTIVKDEVKDELIAEDQEKVLHTRRLKMVQKLTHDLKDFQSVCQCFLLDEILQDWKHLGQTNEHLIRIELVEDIDEESTAKYEIQIFTHDESEDETLIRTLTVRASQITFKVFDQSNYVVVRLKKDEQTDEDYAIMFQEHDQLLQFEQVFHRVLDSLDKNFIPEHVDDEILDADVDGLHKKLLAEEKLLVCLNLVRTKLDSSVRRGAVVKSMTFCSRKRYIYAFRGVLLLALNKYFECETPEDQYNYIANLYHSINSIDLPDFELTEQERRVFRCSRLKIDNQSPRVNETRVQMDFNDRKIPVKLPPTMENDEITDASVGNFVRRFGDNTMTIYNAILVGKRVLFMGHNEPSFDVSNCVLAACMMLSPPMRGILKRAYPYAHLSDISFLDVEGYIAGVTNPIFTMHKNWWDVLVDVTTGNVTLSESLEEEMHKIPPERLSTALDMEFLEKLGTGTRFLYGEEWFRCQFRDYTLHILNIAMGIEEFTKNSVRLFDSRSNSFRIGELVKTTQFREFLVFWKAQQLNSPFGKRPHMDIWKGIRKFQVKKVSEKETLKLFEQMDELVHSRNEMMEFLAMLPESQGGLFPIAVGLFHEWPEVKAKTLDLLMRLDSMEEGVRFLNNLNYFLLMTFYKHRDADLLNQEEEEKTD